MEWLKDDDSDQWSCSYCEEQRLKLERNCQGTGNPRFAKNVYGMVFTSCPLSSINYEVMEVVNIVLLCEGGGMGGSRVLPSVLVGEAVYYFNVRSIVLAEQRRIEKIKDKVKDTG